MSRGGGAGGEGGGGNAGGLGGSETCAGEGARAARWQRWRECGVRVRGRLGGGEAVAGEMGAARPVGAKEGGGGGRDSGTRVLGVMVGGWPGVREGGNVCTARMRLL